MKSTPTISTADMNNPFNIKVGSDTQQYIQQGTASVGRAAPDGGNFLTFKDRNTGVSAAQNLLFSSGVYKGLTVDAALKKWSNNGYGGDIVPSLSGKTIDSLTPDEQTQVLNAMETKGENDATAPGTLTLSSIGKGNYTVGGGKPATPTPTQPASSFGKVMAPGSQPTMAARSGAAISSAVGVVKDIASAMTTSEQGAAADITAALPGSVTGVDQTRAAQQQSNTSDANFLKEMNANKAAGKPITPAQQQILDRIQKSTATPQTDAGAAITPALDKSNAQVAEDFVGVALDVASGGTFGKAAAGMDSGVLAAKTGAPTLLDKGAQVADTLLSAPAKRAAAKEFAAIVDMVKPVANKRVSLAAIRNGLGKAAAWFKPATLDADARSMQAARSVQGVVEKGKSMIENANSVIKAIGDEAASLKSKLATSKVTFTPQELNKALKGVKLPGLLRNNSTLDKTFGEIVSHVIDMSKTMPGKIGSVLDLRQEFDAEVERQFGDIYSSERDLTPVRQAVKAMRDALNDFIEDRVPQLEYKASLHLQSSMYDALENISEKATKEVGKMTPRMEALKKGAGNIAKYGGAVLVGTEGAKLIGEGFDAVMGAVNPNPSK